MNVERVRLPRKLTKSVSGGVLAEANRLHPVGALNITLNMLPLHRVTMTLAENDVDLAMHDLVEVYNQNGSVGIYRVTKITNTLRKERKIELSHGLDVFSDATIARITDSWNGSVRDYLQMIIDGQTQTIGGQFYWQLGQCDDTSYWEKDLKYDNAMSLLTDLAKTEEDYMFTFDQSTFPWTLNFIRRNATVLSEFRLRRNTESCVVTFDDSDLCTRLYLSVTTEEDDDDGYGTYFEEGYYTFDDAAAQAIYGIVCKTAGIDQSVFSPTVDLEAWKNAYFERHNAPNVQITIDGMELNKLSKESIDEMHLGRMCRVALPEYGDTYSERIVSVNYPDALRKPNYVRVSLHNKRETAEDAFQEISDTASSASSSASSGGKSSHNDATYFRRTIGDTANGLYSRIEQTAYYIRSEVVDTANGLYSKIEQTASYIRAEVADTANGLNSKIEQTASYIRAEVSDTANGLNSKIEQTASYIRSEVSDTANGLYSKIEETVSYIRSEVSNTANGLYSKIEQTASYIRSEVSDTANGLSSRIEQNASQIALKVSAGNVATQLAVECGNVTISGSGGGGNLVVDGYVKTSELDATYINSLFSGSQVLSTNYAYIRNLECSSFTQGEYTLDLSEGLTSIELTQSGNTYSLYQNKFYGGTRQLVGTFSRAISSASWEWTGGAAKVTLSPQDQTFYSTAIDQVAQHGQVTWDNDSKGFSVDLDVDDSNGTTVYQETGYHFSTLTSYNAGYNGVKGSYTTSGGVLTVSKASSGANFPMSFSIDAGITYDSSTHKYTAKALCDDTQMDSVESGTEAYTAGVAYGEGKFTLASVTLQGTAYGTITPIGTEHKFTYTHLYKAGTAATYYNAGSSATYYKGNGSTLTGRGTKVSVTPIGTQHKLKYTKLYTDGTNVQWAYVSDSSGSTTWYSAGSATDYYQGNGSTITGRGDSVTVTEQGSSVSVTPQGATQWAYVADSSGTISYYAKGTNITNLRNPGTTNSTTYYTKTS